MKSGTIISLLMMCFACMQAQHPLVKEWDKRFGGTNDDWLYVIIQATDGGYLLGGLSSSNANGDKTQPNWDTTLVTGDYWVVKLDSLGDKQWDKRFGGYSDDALFSIQQALDGGYILGGSSYSGVGGDKTQPSWGGTDYWVVKIDSLGNKQWDKTFGGSNNDFLYALQITRDGGCILAGDSYSEMSGNKSEGNVDSTDGSDDGWVVKLDSLGNKQWDKSFGGIEGKDGVDGSEFDAIQQTSDGGYIIGGTSWSGIGGDITQSVCDTSNLSISAYWLVKIDSAGNLQWQEKFCEGELASLKLTSDGGYILGGLGGGSWIIKTDSSGNEEWNKIYIGDVQEFTSLCQTEDRGYLMAGWTYAGIYGDKTENNLGQAQTWLVKTNSSGNKQWDKTIFTYDNNYGYAIQARDGNYVIGTQCDGGIGGYKTQPNWDTTDNTNDYWVVKMKDTLLNGIDSVSTGSSVQVYPNPFTSDISISIQAHNIQNVTFTISNVLGETVFYKQESNLSNHYTKMLDLSYLANGVYLLEVVVDEERVVQKIVKQ